jgi:TM2 domain-containing membrane protein YozV
MTTFLALLFKYLIIIWFLIKIMLNLVSNQELVNHFSDNYLIKSDNQLIDNKFGLNFDPNLRNLLPEKRSQDLQQLKSTTIESIDESMTTLRINLSDNKKPFIVNCSQLLIGQYDCLGAVIDSETQQPIGCNKNNKALINCSLTEGLVCDDSLKRDFQMTIDCKHTNGYSYETALLLSIFLGMFGADRFYLGYPALGLLKFCTLGFLFLGQLVDIILISMQIVRPADGSYYVIKHFGPKLDILSFNNNTDIIFSDDFRYYVT